MKVFVKGKGEVSLGQANFVAQGGQASVYQKSGTAYKIYTDAKDAIPQTKFTQLAAIQDPDVVKPDDLLVEPKAGSPIGYTMRYVKDTYALCQLFTRSFRDRNGIDHQQIARIISAMRTHVENVHRAGVLVVDLNELNILVDQRFSSVFMIDVDSYQTRDYPATVIMPSVRDYSVAHSRFTPLSDWFSFAVLACHLYLGIHPYKGTHAPSSSVPPDQRLEHRMRANISVFDSAVTLPRAAYPLDVIPPLQREWLRAVLQDGKRLAPPSGASHPAYVVVTHASQMTFGGSLVVTEVGAFEGTILGYWEGGASPLVLTDRGVFLAGHRVHGPMPPGANLLGFTAKMGRPVALALEHGRLWLHEFNERRMTELPLSASEISKSRDRFYLRNQAQVLEVDLTDLTDRVLVTASHPVANVIESASRLFDGVAIQNMLGSVFVSLFPDTRTGYQVRVRELDGRRIVDARFDAGVLMVVTAKSGQYDRLVFRFDYRFASYDVRTIANVTPSGVNFIVVRGICVSVTEEEKIEAFPATPNAPGMRVVEDPAIGGDMRLVMVGVRAGFYRGNKLYTVSLQ